MKKLLIMLFIITIVFGIEVTAIAANHTMSWDFEVFNNASARQIALNVAKTQEGFVKEEKDPIERFKEGLERRLFSSVQRNIVDMIFNDDQVPYGDFEAGDLKITVAEDPQTGEVIVEIFNVVTGDSTLISYSSDEWPTGYDLD